MYQKLVPDLFLILVNKPKQPWHQQILLKIRCFEKGLSEALKKLILVFFLNPLPLNG